MEWESTSFEKEIEFFGSSIGTIKHEGLFTANLTNKSATSSHVESTLRFPSDITLNGTIVVCRDILDGNTQACSIAINFPSKQNYGSNCPDLKWLYVTRFNQ